MSTKANHNRTETSDLQKRLRAAEAVLATLNDSDLATCIFRLRADITKDFLKKWDVWAKLEAKSMKSLT